MSLRVNSSTSTVHWEIEIMRRDWLRRNPSCLFVLGVFVFFPLLGCGSLPENIALGAAGVTAVAARTPAQEIEQIYYLGVFDPQEQVKPEVYRVRVRGQASIMSGMDFGSGWVPASIIDALGSSISFKDGKVVIDKSGQDFGATFLTGRKLMLFGPEGFREAPKDHRLVIVMGASPEKFFNAMDQSLTAANQAIQAQSNAGLTQLLAGAQSEALAQRRRLDEVKKDATADLSVKEEATQ